jgi:hypothetical protein
MQVHALKALAFVLLVGYKQHPNEMPAHQAVTMTQLATKISLEPLMLLLSNCCKSLKSRHISSDLDYSFSYCHVQQQHLALQAQQRMQSA